VHRIVGAAQHLDQPEQDLEVIRFVLRGLVIVRRHPKAVQKLREYGAPLPLSGKRRSKYRLPARKRTSLRFLSATAFFRCILNAL
jgi:hypothetical protein